jgi:hypothetical protein
MKIDFFRIKWILLGIYIALLLIFFALIYFDAGPKVIHFVFYELRGKGLFTAGALLVTLLSQGIFIFSQMTGDLCKPVRKRSLVLPVLIAGLMLASLVAAASLEIGRAHV